MEGLRKTFRALIPAALLTGLLAALPSVPALTCDAEDAHAARVAGEGKQTEGHGSRDKCKRTPGMRVAPKGCPDGGERLPNENNNNKRSPLDDAPPLAPLVA